MVIMMGLAYCPPPVDIWPSTGLISRRARANVDNHKPLRLDDWATTGSDNHSLSRVHQLWISKCASACAIVAPTSPPASTARRTIRRQPNRRRRLHEAIRLAPVLPAASHHISNTDEIFCDAPRAHLTPRHEDPERTFRCSRRNFDF